MAGRISRTSEELLQPTIAGKEALEVSASTVQRVRKCCAQHGVQEAIVPQAVSRARRRRLDGAESEHI